MGLGNIGQTTWRLVKIILRTFCFFVCSNFITRGYCIVFILLRPLRIVNASLFRKIEGRLFRLVQSILGRWMVVYGYTVVEVGDDVSDIYDDETLVISNHQSTADVPILISTLTTKDHVIDNILWIMDDWLMYLSVGWCCFCHGDFFIKQGKQTRHLQPILLRDHILQDYQPNAKKWIVLFPEGGFLRKRRKRSQEYARKNGYPVLEHVTLPRIGAMQSILNTMSPRSIQEDGDKQQTGIRPLKWIIDITVGYPERPLDMQTLAGGLRDPVATTLCYRKYPAQDVPIDTEGLTTWLYDRFVEKEKMLEEFYKTGKFPVLQQDDGKHIITEPKLVRKKSDWVCVEMISFWTLAALEMYLVCYIAVPALCTMVTSVATYLGF